MPQIGPLEILVVGVIALIVFGPEKLPQIARQMGKAATELRRMASDVKQEFDAGLEEDEDVEDVEDERETPPSAEDRATDQHEQVAPEPSQERPVDADERED